MSDDSLDTLHVAFSFGLLSEEEKEAILAGVVRRVHAIAKEMGMEATVRFHAKAAAPGVVTEREPRQTFGCCHGTDHSLVRAYDVAGTSLYVEEPLTDAAQCATHNHPCPLWKSPK